MGVDSAFSSGLLGIQRGMERLDDSARQLASRRQLEEHPSPAEPLVDAGRAQLQTDASADVIRTENEIIGTLLDETV